eukprot:6114451-Pleurochrysis_carterae.AAC.3
MCFAYGLSDRGWVAIIVISIIALCSWSTKYLYDPAAKVTIKAYGGKAIFFDVVEAFSAVMAPRLLFGVDASTRFSVRKHAHTASSSRIYLLNWYNSQTVIDFRKVDH